MPRRPHRIAFALAAVVAVAVVGFAGTSSGQLEPCWGPCDGPINQVSKTGYGNTCDEAKLDADQQVNHHIVATCSRAACWQNCTHASDCVFENGQWRFDTTWQFICRDCI